MSAAGDAPAPSGLSEPSGSGAAARRWRDALEGWRLPDELLAAAPEDPYRFDAGQLERPGVDQRDTPTGERVLALLGAPPSRLLDVGCGPGAISVAFAPEATVVGVEPQPHLAAAARERGLTVVEGSWPEVANGVAPADVVLCTHVLYNVADLTPFVEALHDHARLGVVVELTATHPWTGLGPLYRHFHDLDRPDGPTANLAADVIEAAVGRRVQRLAWERPAARYPDLDTVVAHRRRQLCLTPAADAEIADLLTADGTVTLRADGTVDTGPVALTTLWWPTSV